MLSVSSSSQGSLKLWYPVAFRNRIINKMFQQIHAGRLSRLSNILETLCFDFHVDSLRCQAHRKMQHKRHPNIYFQTTFNTEIYQSPKSEEL